MKDVLDGLIPEQIEQLRLLIVEVLRVNQQFNLTAVRDAEEAWNKHILDSLQGLQTGLFEGHRRVVDIGAGAGFPGLPLALVRPELKLTSLEATRKKCDFIAATGAKFNLNAKTICDRAETIGQNKMYRESFQVAIARAVGSVAEVCELALPLVKVGGHLVLWRGERAPEELAVAHGAIKQLGGAPGDVLPYDLPGHTLKYHLITINKITPTRSQFPRRIGLPKQRPL
ncbi:MAG: 16S rRNA (guanine(527)-N(7))-methyltransferase RsmG [Abitibacteriaceae bacterium]|nr:16S rRNA (guanine(527)-N(7))-methyltransferase RsmG [Abditibacteriaceae bacterium]